MNPINNESHTGVMPLLCEYGNERALQLGLTIPEEEILHDALEGFMHDTCVQEIIWQKMRRNTGLDEQAYIEDAVKAGRPVYFAWMRRSAGNRVYPQNLPHIPSVELYTEDGNVYVGSPLHLYSIGREDSLDRNAMAEAMTAEYRALCEYVGCDPIPLE